MRNQSVYPTLQGSYTETFRINPSWVTSQLLFQDVECEEGVTARSSKEARMFRYSNIDVVRLSLVMLSLVLTSCAGELVSITQSPTTTENPSPSPTLEPESLVSKIDKTLNLLT